MHIGDEALEAAVDESLDLFGVLVLGDAGEPDQIGEQNGDDASFFERRQRVAA
jgi:hypothetical protein